MQTGTTALLYSLPSHLSSPSHPPPPQPHQQFKHFRFCFAKNHRRPWDFNAESIQNQKFSFNSRRDDDGVGDGDDDDRFFSSRRRRPKRRRRWWSDGDGYSSGPENEWLLILGQVIDSVWILKVFKSYGWTLPVVVSSLVLATGPKAFLMSLALPIGQSLVTFAFSKLWEWIQGSPKDRPSTRRDPYSINVEDFTMEDEEEREGESWTVRKQRKVYQSWVNGKNDATSNKRSAPTFGGWDELVGETKPGNRRGPELDQAETPLEKGNVSSRVKGRDLPLMLRLLVAIFPFLSSWTSLL
ncbi:hypothetical protein Dimus_001727 [Dionaea muscipula]